MTEKEFLVALSPPLPDPPRPSPISVAEAALRLAKEAGAKFEPEPVALPKLYAAEASSSAYAPRCFLMAGAEYPSYEHLIEVARRCNSWPALRKLWASMRDGTANPYFEVGNRLCVPRRIDAILEGRE